IEVTDDDCCICYGAMLDDDEDGTDLSEHSNSNGSRQGSNASGLNRDTDHVLENFCVVKQHVAHRGCIRKWYNYGPKGYRPMEALRILSWGTTLHGAAHPDQQQHHHQHQHESTHPADVAEPVLRPLFPQPTDEYNRNAGRKTCPACRQQLVLNFVDLAKGRKEMGWTQKMVELGRDMTKFSDWRGLALRSLITAGWVGVTIVGGKLRIVAMDKAIVKHQKNRALATLSALAASS
ncbi:hypothetical protein BGX29_001467, partial [Mortierella sp. GBA35]